MVEGKKEFELGASDFQKSGRLKSHVFVLVQSYELIKKKSKKYYMFFLFYEIIIFPNPIKISPPSLFYLPSYSILTSSPLLSCQSLTSNHQLMSPICLPHPSLLLSFQKRVGVPWTSARPNISSNDMITHLLSY